MPADELFGLVPSGMLALVPDGDTGEVVALARGATSTLCAGDTVPLEFVTVPDELFMEDGRLTTPVRGTVDPGEAAPSAPGVPTVVGGTWFELPGDTDAPGTGELSLPLELGPPVLPSDDPGTLLLRLPADGESGAPGDVVEPGLICAAVGAAGDAGAICAEATPATLPIASATTVAFITFDIDFMSFSD
ncbi:MAG: hypothetical protein JWQ11_1746 [Rhizobacter sp.]|nr:hypothetical protein [Rhizobacter sp.]